MVYWALRYVSSHLVSSPTTPDGFFHSCSGIADATPGHSVSFFRFIYGEVSLKWIILKIST